MNSPVVQPPEFDFSHLSDDNSYFVETIGGGDSPTVLLELARVDQGQKTHRLPDEIALTQLEHIVQLVSRRDGKQSLAALGRRSATSGVWGPELTAATLIALHQQLLYLSDDSSVAANIAEVIKRSDGFDNLVDVITGLGDDWCKSVDLTDESGKPIIDPETGKPYFVWELHEDVMKALRTPLLDSLRLTQSDERFQALLWEVQDGVTVEECQSTDSSEQDDAYLWRLKNKTPKHGLIVEDLQVTEQLSAGSWAIEDALSGAIPGESGTWPDILVQIGEVRTRISPLDGAPAQQNISVLNTDHGEVEIRYWISATRPSYPPKVHLQIGPSPNCPVVTLYDKERATGAELTLRDVSGLSHIRVTVKNKFIRHLSAHVQFLDTGGTPFAPENWDEVLPEELREVFQPNDTKKLARVIPPVETMVGIPVRARKTEISFYFPPQAAQANFLMGTWGTGSYDSEVCRIGLVLTMLLDLMLPIILAAAGSGTADEQLVNECIDNEDLFNALLGSSASLVGSGVESDITQGQDPQAFVIACVGKIADMLIKGPLRKYLQKKLEKSFLGKCIPLVNLAMRIYDSAETIAVVSQTTHAVLSSPFVFEVNVARSMNVNCRLLPDAHTKEFPRNATSCSVTYVYDSDATFQKFKNESWSGGGSQSPYPIAVKSLPAGGRIKAIAELKTKNGWVSAQGESDWFDAEAHAQVLDIGDIVVSSNVVPITSTTKMQHSSRLSISDDGSRVWLKTDEAPKETRADLDPRSPKSLAALLDITLCQSAQSLGIAYQATGLNLPPDDPNKAPSDRLMHQVQNLSTSADPGKNSSESGIGFTLPPGIQYLLTGENGINAAWYIDSSNPDFDPQGSPNGGYHLRRLDLSGPPDFDAARQISYGRFSCLLEDFAIHPSGYVCGIHREENKLALLQIEQQGVKDADAGIAQLVSGQGERPGLVHEPQSVAVSGDGRILVLEDFNQRIQAFDVAGNPVPCFAGKPFFKLIQRDGRAQHQSLDVDPTGYVFVSGYLADGDKPDNYFIDIYGEAGTHISRTYGVAAGRIAVTLLRNLYTLNFEQLMPSDQRPQPSISYWEPSLPRSS